MDVSNLRPLLRVVSGAGDPDDDDHARHDQRREDDELAGLLPRRDLYLAWRGVA